MSSQQRNRGAVRVSLGTPAVVAIPYGAGQISRFEGIIDNVSTSGLRIVLSDNHMGPIAPGAKARISVIRKGSPTPLELTGSVVSTAEVERQFNISVRFDRPYYDAVKNVASFQQFKVELNPYGWTDYRLHTNTEPK